MTLPFAQTSSGLFIILTNHQRLLIFHTKKLLNATLSPRIAPHHAIWCVTWPFDGQIFFLLCCFLQARQWPCCSQCDFAWGGFAFVAVFYLGDISCASSVTFPVSLSAVSILFASQSRLPHFLHEEEGAEGPGWSAEARLSIRLVKLHLRWSSFLWSCCLVSL